MMKWVWRIWFLLYVITLLYTVFFASRRPKPVWGAHREIPLLSPFKMKLYLYKHANNLSSLYLDVVGNVIMFVPMTLFLYIVLGIRRYDIMVITAFVCSCFIEIIQYSFGVGMPDIDDVIFNTSGAILGVVIIHGVKNVALR